MKTKTCVTCGQVRSLKEFPKRKSSKDGYRGQCRWCKKLKYTKNLYTVRPNKYIFKKDHIELIIDSKKYGIKKVLIDTEDYEKVNICNWGLHQNRDNNFYIRGRNNNKRIFLHRIIMDCPDDMIIDHINHNVFDNRKKKLRICTILENNHNRLINKNNTSGCNGVYWIKNRSRWTVRFSYKNKVLSFGYYKDYNEAVLVYKKEIKKYRKILV